jgi:DNA-binding response OmpR family regulator
MSTATPSILLADEDDAVRTFLADNLTYDGYQVKTADSRAKANALLSVEQPQLIILDINGQTLELLHDIRNGERLPVDPDTPIIVLTRRPGDIHRTRVLDSGGDDILAKPFSYPELRARVGAVLRRAERRQHPRHLRCGSLVIDVAARQVRYGQEPIELPAKEYELLVALANDPHRVFTREELLESVWGLGTWARTRTIDSHACRLRHKLSHRPERFVVNVWGVGYRLMDAECHPMQRPSLQGSLV